MCDVISRWETALREKGMGKFENKRVIRFVYQNRLFWRKHVAGEVERERLLFTYQVSKQIVQGRFPLNKELAFELTALMAQVNIALLRDTIVHYAETLPRCCWVYTDTLLRHLSESAETPQTAETQPRH